MNKKFETLFKSVCESFDTVLEGTGTLQPFMRVEFTKNATKDPYLTERPFELTKVENLIKSKKNIVVLSPKSLQGTQGGASDGLQGDFYTVAAEITYGYWDPNTTVNVPVGVLVPIKEEGNNKRKLTDDIKRPNNNTDKPIKLDSKSEKLPSTNTSLPNGKKWDDKQAGGGNLPKKDYSSSR